MSSAGPATGTPAVSVPPAAPAVPAPARGNVWGGLLVVLVLAAVFVPPFVLGENRYRMPQYTKYVALALFALSVDVIWGYTGLLSLGQGLYFGLGAYALAYSLKLQRAAELAGLPPTYGPEMARPDFMIQTRIAEVPAWLGPLIDTRIALSVAVLLPLLLAALFGGIVFRRGLKGVYFSLITQALVLAVFTLVSSEKLRGYTAGVDGITDLASLKLFGVEFESGSARLYFLIAGALTVCFLLCAGLMRSKFGKILTGIRDNENRVLALGYNTAAYKTFAFALSGAMAGLAGALFVAANESAGPQFFGIADSIEVVVLVAVGGRGTLIGAIVGAALVSMARTYVNEWWNVAWPIILGGLFVGVVAFLPEGVVGLIRRVAARLGRRRAAPAPLP